MKIHQRDEQIRAALHDYAQQGIPEDSDLWPGLQQQLAQAPARRPQFSSLLPRLRLAAALLLALLLTSTGVYAGLSVVSRLFHSDEGLARVQQAQLTTPLQLTQTLDGVSVTLEQAYADGNRIALGLSIKGPDGRRYDPERFHLTGADGTEFQSMIGYGVTGQSEVLDLELPPGQGAYVLTFDGSRVRGQPAQLALRLELTVASFQIHDVPTPSIALPTSSVPLAAEGHAQAVERLRAAGPFVFEFSVPFHPSRVSEPRQQVESGGIMLELRRVEMTPSETRFTLCLTSPNSGTGDWAPTGELDLGDRVLHPTLFHAVEAADGQRCGVVSYMIGSDEQRGAWTLKIAELVSFAGSEQMRLQGDWRFTIK